MRVDTMNRQTEILSSGFLLFAYNIAIVNTAINNNPIPWYIVMMVCAIKGLKFIRMMGSQFAMLLTLSGFFTVLNALFIGNADFSKVLLLLLSFLSVLYFINTDIDPKALLLDVIVIIVWFIYRYLSYGRDIDAILNGPSYNYISVYVLIPVLLFYVTSEIKGDTIMFWPAITAMIICIIATGRSGIIASVFLMAGVYIVKFFSGVEKSSRFRKIISAVIIMIMFVIFVIRTSDLLRSNYLSKLLKYGFEGRGRFEIWWEYIEAAIHDPIYFLYGVDVQKLDYIMKFGGNPHNLLLATHQLSGVITLVFLCMVISNCLYQSFREKRYICCVSSITFLLRGLTDNFIWCSFAMVPFLIMLFSGRKVIKS